MLNRFGDSSRKHSLTPRGAETVAWILKELLSRERQRAGVFPKTFKHPTAAELHTR